MNLQHWVQTQFPETPVQLHAINNDASARCYFRFRAGDQAYIAIDSQLPLIKNQAFISIAITLKNVNIRTPDMIAYDLSKGFLIVSDLGNQLFSETINLSNLHDHYQHAINLLFTMQNAEQHLYSSLEKFDATFILMELDIFKEWFIEKYLDLQLSSQQLTELDHCFNILVENNLQQPQGLMHRDYHCRNLILMNNNEIGVLDFQDAMIGPMTYDCVSLLKDCYVNWPKNKVNALALHHCQLLSLHIKSKIGKQQYMRWFDLTGLQRHLKVLGIFTRLYLRDNKPEYLQYLDRVINYIIEVTVKVDSLKPLHQLFVEIIIPKLEKVRNAHLPQGSHGPQATQEK